uniref:Uncharacterized protein n=1 Tax=Cajanus cajan TaxID=3821 RepID=A0A151S227_CAJCA|nr:hypothetical protein KK1_029410 [Cajanus cajan]
MSIDSLNFNAHVFGNIFGQKKKLEAGLRGIQRALENIDSTHLVILKGDLLCAYEDVLFQEETLWFQKSKEKWVKLGNRNSFFFHVQTIGRKKNKIHELFLPLNEWCTNAYMLPTKAMTYFKNLVGLVSK